VDLFLHIANSIVLRENLDAEERWFLQDLRGGSGPRYNADVRNSKTGGRDLDTLFRDNDDIPLFLSTIEVTGKCCLQPAVIPFAHVSLHDAAVDVVAVGMIAGVEILVHGDQR